MHTATATEKNEDSVTSRLADCEKVILPKIVYVSALFQASTLPRSEDKSRAQPAKRSSARESVQHHVVLVDGDLARFGHHATRGPPLALDLCST